jgi:hypothetical protein
VGPRRGVVGVAAPVHRFQPAYSIGNDCGGRRIAPILRTRTFRRSAIICARASGNACWATRSGRIATPTASSSTVARSRERTGSENRPVACTGGSRPRPRHRQSGSCNRRRACGSLGGDRRLPAYFHPACRRAVFVDDSPVCSARLDAHVPPSERAPLLRRNGWPPRRDVGPPRTSGSTGRGAGEELWLMFTPGELLAIDAAELGRHVPISGQHRGPATQCFRT